MTTLYGIHHVGIVVESVEASTAWYVGHLGFERLYEYGWPGVQVAFIGRGALILELFQNDEAVPMVEDRRRAETNLKSVALTTSPSKFPTLMRLQPRCRQRGFKACPRRVKSQIVAAVVLHSSVTMNKCSLSYFSLHEGSVASRWPIPDERAVFHGTHTLRTRPVSQPVGCGSRLRTAPAAMLTLVVARDQPDLWCDTVAQVDHHLVLKAPAFRRIIGAVARNARPGHRFVVPSRAQAYIAAYDHQFLTPDVA